MNKEQIQMICNNIDMACEHISVTGSHNMAQILGIKSAVNAIRKELIEEEKDGGQEN